MTMTEIDTHTVARLTSDQLDTIARTPIVDTLSGDVLGIALASPPFLLVPCRRTPSVDDDDKGHDATRPAVACVNFRDAWSDERTPEIHARRIYRAGKSAFSGTELARLGIKRVYDLRSVAERQQQSDDADSHALQGVDVVWLEPTSSLSQYMQQNVQQAKGHVGMEKSILINSYMRILESHKDIFRRILLDFARVETGEDVASSAILLHCTAGKDRTGVATAMLLSLAGCSDEGIAKEYALTRIGIEPSRERLSKALQVAMRGPAFNETHFRALSESKEEDMLAFLACVRTTYGGFESYARDVLQLAPEQIQTAVSKFRRTP